MSRIDDYKVGMTVYGQISGIKPYGAFVRFEDGVTGLIHISELSKGYVRNVDHFVKLGEYVMVKVIDVDRKNRQLRLSFKDLSQNMRKYRKKVRFEGLPDDRIGFRTIEEKMPEWLKGEYDDQSRS